MTDTLKIKGAIVASGYSRPKIAEMLGVTPFTLHKKIHNKTEFKASEIELLVKVCKITDVDGIFFANEVEEKSTNADVERD